MSADDLATTTSQPEFKVGGLELLPIVQPLWEALFDKRHASSSAGLPVRPREESWTLRYARYEDIFELNTAFVIVAHEAGVPVGYALAYEDDPIVEAGDGAVVTVESLTLLPDAAGQDLARQLLAAVEAEAASRWDAKVTAIEVTAGNEPAEQFYEGAGFVERGETWLRLAPAGKTVADTPEIDDDLLGDLLDGWSDDFAIGVEEGPDDTWLTSDLLVAVQPDPGVPADGDVLESEIAPYAKAGAFSALVALDSDTDAGWPETLTKHGFTKILRLLTRSISAS